jgi:uncharacterized RDD family membrane protein YckC
MDEPPVSTNPYQAPQAEVNLSGAAAMDALPDAGQGARLANLFIDNIIRVVVAGLLSGVLQGLGVFEASDVMATIVVIFSFVGYYILLESLFGWTIGKLITGTRVVTQDGEKPGFLRVCGRTLARFIPFEPFSFLFGKAGWHDALSGTRVVRVRR